MKALIITILLIVNGSFVIAQDTTGLKKATAALNMALLEKDSVGLKKLMADHLLYGHSNLWLQSKQEVIADLFNGKIGYKKIETGTENFTINDDVIAVRSITKVEGILKGTAFGLNLQVLQVWKKIKKNWVLIARQSVKIS